MNNKFNFKKIEENQFLCSITGLIASDFIYKKVNNKTVYQSKIFLNDYNLKINIIKTLKENNYLTTDEVKYSNLIIINIWNLEVYEQYKDFLKKGSYIEIQGILKYKIYNRFCGGQRLQLFFIVNNIFKVKQPKQEYTDDFFINNKFPQIVYSQF